MTEKKRFENLKKLSEKIYIEAERDTGEVEVSVEVGTIGYKVTDELKLCFSTFDLAYWLFFSSMETA